jgi:hypothetical protein
VRQRTELSLRAVIFVQPALAECLLVRIVKITASMAGTHTYPHVRSAQDGGKKPKTSFRRNTCRSECWAEGLGLGLLQTARSRDDAVDRSLRHALCPVCLWGLGSVACPVEGDRFVRELLCDLWTLIGMIGAVATTMSVAAAFRSGAIGWIVTGMSPSNEIARSIVKASARVTF